MSTGVSVLASNTAPVRYIISHDKSGILIEPYDIDEMVEHAINMLSTPKQYIGYRDEARAAMVANYGFDMCLPRLAEYYCNNFSEPSTVPANNNIFAV